MTTYVNFTPSTAAPFTFQATLDGQTYNCSVTWNLFRGSANPSTLGYYLNVYDLGGDLVVSTALAASPEGIGLQGITWAGGIATATALAPHGYPVGSIVNLVISGVNPSAYNTTADCYITGPTTFTYPLATNPGGPATQQGTASFNLNLVGGQADANGNPFSSTLVFRESSNQFEISP